MFKILLCMFTLLLVGCMGTTPTCSEPRVITKIEIVEKTIPIKCKVPEVHCEFGGDDFEPTQKLLKCIVEQKRALEVCKENISTDPRIVE